MESDDLANVLMLGDDIAMQWYVLTHPGSQLPAPAPDGQIALPGVRATFNPNLLIVGVIIVAAILVMRK